VILAACICLMQAGVRKCMLNPFMLICLSYFRFFGLAMKHSPDAEIVDLAHLVAFLCFSIAFLYAWKGSQTHMRRLLTSVWPHYDQSRSCPASLTWTTMVVLAGIAIGYAILDVWLASLAYGGVGKALVRFYVLTAETDVSPWLMRVSRVFYWVSIMVVFVLRLNYALYGRGRMLGGLALLANLAAAFPAGSAGRLIAPIIVYAIADVLAALHRNGRLRPRLDVVVLGALAICAGTLLHVIRSTSFRDIHEVVDVVIHKRDAMPQSLVSAASHSHGMVSEDTAFCMRTFGRSQDFLPAHSLYTIVVNPIPREMWPAKPIAFGRVLGQIRQGQYGSPRATAEGWSIAAGLAGEGYANGGYFGIIFLSLLVGYLCGKAAKCASIGFFMPSYPIIMISLGLYRFSSMFVRGDVHSAWTSTVYPLGVLVIGVWAFGRLATVFQIIVRGSLEGNPV